MKGSVNTCWINLLSYPSVFMVWFISSIFGKKGLLEVFVHLSLIDLQIEAKSFRKLWS